jgi:hypothetical protein
MRSSHAAPRVEPPTTLPRPDPAPRAEDVALAALAALCPLEGAEVLVASGDDAEAFGRALRAAGARATLLALPSGGWRTAELPAWGFDAVLAEGFLSRVHDVDGALHRLRAWARPGAPLVAVEPLAPGAWDPAANAPGPALSARDLEIVRRQLPTLRVMRLPVGEPGSWAEALRSAVEPFLPVIARTVRVAVLTARLSP